MKTTKYLFWITTGLLSLMVLLSAFSNLTELEVGIAFQCFGFTDYFRIELAIAKLMGIILLLVPSGFWLKEWVYGGFFITYMSVLIANLSVKDPFTALVMPLIALIFLYLSYVSYKKRQYEKFRFIRVK